MKILPLSQPDTPFLALIPSAFRPGEMIRIAGKMLDNDSDDRFVVNIRTSRRIFSSNYINLHLSVRPDENAIVRNTYVNGWGPEERDGGCPIEYGERFEMTILGNYDEFKVEVNDRPFCTFAHRIPLSTAKYIQIFGLVRISSISKEQSIDYPRKLDCDC